MSSVAPDPHAPIAARIDQVRAVLVAAAGRHTLAPALLYAVIHEESGGDPDAYRVECPLGDASFGLMQLLLGTARGLGYQGPPRMLFDAGVNLELGAQYLARLFRQHHDQQLVLLEYNGGPRAVAAWAAGRRAGPAVAYMKTVLALEAYYDRREKARAAGA
jgi:soluble lytic murein transglycosylase-like protein